MPYKKRNGQKKTSRYVRRYRRKKRYPRYKAMGGFPSNKIVRLRYVDEISIDAGVGAFGQHQFRANSVFDPDYTGAGHQPMNFDKWASLYEHYTVLGSKCNVKPLDYNSTTLGPGYCGIFLSTDSAGTSDFTNVTDVFENRLASSRWMMLGSITATPAQVTAGGVTSYFSAKKIFGVKNAQDGRAYGALVTTNPSADAYFNVYIASIYGNNPAATKLLVTIDYIVMFAEPITQAQN